MGAFMVIFIFLHKINSCFVWRMFIFIFALTKLKKIIFKLFAKHRFKKNQAFIRFFTLIAQSIATFAVIATHTLDI